jgi:hypothetical protein
MKKLILAICLCFSISPLMAATPTTTNTNTATNGFDQAADTIGVGIQSYNPHLSSSSIKTPPNDNIDDVIQNSGSISSS